jgi:hypothetical protein
MRIGCESRTRSDEALLKAIEGLLGTETSEAIGAALGAVGVHVSSSCNWHFRLRTHDRLSEDYASNANIEEDFAHLACLWPM